jgi:hypothetical protein
LSVIFGWCPEITIFSSNAGKFTSNISRTLKNSKQVKIKPHEKNANLT